MIPTVTIDPSIRITSMRRVRLNSQGYAADGTYYGIGAPVYRIEYEYDAVQPTGNCEFCGISERAVRYSASPCGPNPTHQFLRRRFRYEDSTDLRAADRDSLRERIARYFCGWARPIKFQRGTR